MLLIYYSCDNGICRTGFSSLDEVYERLHEDWVEPDIWALFDSDDHAVIENNGMVILDKGDYLLVYDGYSKPERYSDSPVAFLEKGSWRSTDVCVDDDGSFYAYFSDWDDDIHDYVEEIIPVEM